MGVAPHSGRVENLAGVAEARVQLDRETRTLTYHRTLKIADRYFEPPEAYKALRDLYEVMVRSDAEALVLVGP